MKEIKLIKLIKLPFTNIPLLLLFFCILLFISYSYNINFNNTLMWKGYFNKNYQLISSNMKINFRTYLFYEFGENFIVKKIADKEDIFIIYNIDESKYPAISELEGIGEKSKKFNEVALRDKYYSSDIYLEMDKLINQDNIYNNKRINQLKDIIDIYDKTFKAKLDFFAEKLGNEDYPSLPKDMQTELFYSLNEFFFQDELRDNKKTYVDQIIELKALIRSNMILTDRSTLTNGKMIENIYASNSSFFLYSLAIILAIFLAFIYNFIFKYDEL